MDKNNMQISIEAIDNFSATFDKLNKKLGEVDKKKANVSVEDMKSINRLMDELGSKFNSLNDPKFVKGSAGSVIEKELKQAIDAADKLQKKLDSLNFTSSKIRNNKLSSRYNYKSSKDLPSEYDYAKNLLNGRKQDFIKISIDVDKSKSVKNVENAQKDIQKSIDNKPLKQTVEVSSVSKNKQNDSKIGGKVQVQTEISSESLSKIKDKIENIKPEVNVGVKISLKDLKSLIKEFPSFDDIRLGINQDKWSKSLEEAKRKLVSLIGTTHKVPIVIDKDKLDKSIADASKRVDKLESERHINLSVNSRSIHTTLQNIAAKLDVITKKKTLDIDTDSRKIITKIQNINGRLDALSNKPINVKGDINTSTLESKIIRLATYINQLNSKDIKPKVDKGISDIVKLSTYMNQLNSKKVNPVVDVNISRASSGITAIYKMLQELQSKKYKINLDTSDLQGKNNQLKTLANTLKSIANYLKQIRSRNININFNTKNADRLVKTIRSLNEELQNVKKNIIINIKVNDNSSEQKLRNILALLKQIKRNSRVNINTNSRNNVGFGGGNSRAGNGNLFLGNFMAGTIQFLGRSSKGFGSFLEAIARITQNMISMGNTIGKTGIIIMSSIPAVAAVIGVSFGLAVKSVQDFGNMLLQVGSAIYTALKPGIDLYNQRTKAELALGAGARSMATIDDRQITDEESKVIGQSLTNKAIRDAAKSVFNPSELIDAMQGVMPMLFARGMTAEQAYQTTKGVASVAKLGRLAPNQVLQETRDLAQGSITARTSQVANLLGITNADINQFKGDADALYDYLMDKFKEYSKALDEYANTPIGAFEQLQETIAIAGESLVSKLAQPFVEVFHVITDSLGDFVDEQGHILDENGQYLDEYGNKVDGVGVASYQVCEPLQNFSDALEEIIEYALQAIDELADYIGIIDNSRNATDFFVEAMKFLIDAFVISVKFVKAAGQTVLGFGKAVEFITVPVLEFLSRMVNLVRIAITGWEDLSNLMAGATGNLSINEVKNRLDANEKLRQELTAENEKSYASSFLEFFKKHGFVNSVEDGALLKAYREGRERVKQEAKNKTSTDVNLNDVKGKGTSSSKEDEKARKNATKESQKMLKEQLSALKEALKDSLSQLKDILNKNKIAYDEGFMSIKDYFTQKAEIEAQEAELRLKEANDELSAIMNAQWDNDYDRDKELHRVNREIREYSRQLGNAKTSIAEINRAWKEGVQSLNSFTAYMRNGIGAIAPNTKLSSNNINTIKDKDPYTYIALKASEMIKEKGGNVPAGWLLGQIKQEVGNLDSGSELSRTHNNYSGIKWYPGAKYGTRGSISPEGDYYQKFETIDDYIAEKVKVYFQSNFKDATFNSKTPEDFVSNLYNGGWFESGYNSYVSNVKNGENLLNERLLHLGISAKDSSEALNGLSSSVNGLSNIENAASVLLSASGEVLGYTPEQQYSLGGIDTRYATFEDMSSGVENQIAGLDDRVRQVINLMNKLYYEATGEKVTYTSFTGDLTGGYNPHQPSSSGMGHREGWKADSYVSNGEQWVKIAKALGVATRWENHHWDTAFGLGNTYQGGWGTKNINSPELYEKLKSAVSAGVREGGLGFIPGVSLQTAPNTIETSNAFQQAWDSFRDKLKDLAKDAEGNILDIYNIDFVSGIKSSIISIQSKYDKQLKELETNMKKYPETIETYQSAYQNLVNIMNVELEDAFVNYLEKRLSYNVDASNTWGKYAAFETFMGNGMNPYEFLGKYQKYYYNDENNPLAPASVIKKMWDSVAKYQNLGAVDKAQQLRQKILDTYDNLNNIFNKYLDYVNDYFSNYKTWLSNTEATNLQKERGEAEIIARENEVKSNILAMQIDNNEKQLESYKTALDQVISRIEELKKLEKETSDESEKQKYNVEIHNLEAQEAGLKLSRQQLQITNEQLKVNKLLADQLKEQPNLYKKIRTTAKQALEDGLVTFLTDGINEAESLGDALRDLAVNFLKTMQKMFAEQLVTGLMNKWFPVMTENPTDPSGRKQDPYAVSTGYLQKFYGNSAIINPNQFGFNNAIVQNKNVGFNNPFSQPWETSILNQNAIKPWEDKDAWSAEKFSLLSTNTEMASDKLGEFNLGLNTSTQTIDTVKSAIQAATTAQEASTAVEKVAESAKQVEASTQTMFDTALQTTTTFINSLGTAAQGAASMLNMLGGVNGAKDGGIVKLSKGGTVFHNNGVITGSGSSTSDSIPAMLSNGEAVLNAKAVKNLGTGFISAVNNGNFSKIRATIPHLSEGGTIGEAQQGTARGITDFAKSVGTSVTTTNQMNIALVRDEREAMEHFMRSPAGQRIMVDFQRGNGRVMSRFNG